MSVFLLALVGPTALETSLLSLDFIDVVSPFFSFFYYPTLVHFIYILPFYSTYLDNLA